MYTDASLRWLENLLYERFGHYFMLREYSNRLILSMQGQQNTIIFDELLSCFQRSSSDFSCHKWMPGDEGFSTLGDEYLPMPGLSESCRVVECVNDDILVHYDILGLTYWMLTRLEEVGAQDLDYHGRFLATMSHAFRFDYLERPIVDEWLEILGQVILKQWPNIVLKKNIFFMKVSHDVDRPSRYAFKKGIGFIRAMGGDLLRKGSRLNAISAPWVKLTSRSKISTIDPYNTFNWIMDQSESIGLTSAFYFLCSKTHPTFDADYKLDHQIIRRLIREIHQRGHEVGLHPSYGTFKTPELIIKEANALRNACREEGVKQEQWGGRMHYLRWEHPTTLLGWERANMTYDSSLGYADRPGFRCGTCYEYFAFDPVSQKPLNLRIRPLVVMECTIISSQYLGLGLGDAAFDKIDKLKAACKRVNGSFTLLWHNSSLTSNHEKSLYSKVINS